MTHITGAFAPVPTPLDRDLVFEPAVLGRHLQWLKGEGLDGALVLGTNGEFPSFSLDERLAVARAAAEVDSGLELMLGIGSCAVSEALAMTQTAAESGYGSVLAPPPFYFRSAPVAGLARYFLQILDSSPLPVLLYHIPQVTGVPISDDLLEAIGPHERLAGVKDSSADPSELDRLSSHFASGSYLVGTDRLVTACLSVGGKGSISAAASVTPALVCEVHRGEAPQEDLDLVRGFLEDWGLGPSVKTILKRTGFGEYRTRPPLLDPTPEQEQQLWNGFEALAVGAPQISAE
jgi:4-hydroxy-tetrahydrodipicolinate synthase